MSDHKHLLSPKRLKKWKLADQGYYHQEDGEVIATGDTIRKKSTIGPRPSFRVGAIVASSNGLATIAYKVGIRTGLYLGNSSDLSGYEKVELPQVMPRAKKKSRKRKT